MTDIQEVLPIDTDQVCSSCDTSVQVLHKCDHCRELICDGCSKEHEGTHYCDACFSENFYSCEGCNAIIHSDDMHCGEDTCYCESCYDQRYQCCNDCNEVFPIGELTSTGNDRSVCDSCREDYSYCDGCNEYYSDSGRYCERCDEYRCEYCSCGCKDEIDLDDHGYDLKNHGASAITDYHPSVNWEFLKHKTDNSSDPYFGVELEIETPKEDYKAHNDAVKHIGNKLAGSVLCSHDGSINHGFEIIFTPHKRKQFRTYNLKEILKGLSDLGCTSYEKATCGLHVHIERTAFLKKERVHGGSTFTMAMIYQSLMYILRSDIIKFSKRTEDQISHYCKFNRHHSSYGGDRYSAVNLSNNKTIEIRIWRGTLEPKRFRANILFTLCLVDFLKAHSFTLILGGNQARIRQALHDFILQSKEYQALIPELKRRNLFNFRRRT